MTRRSGTLCQLMCGELAITTVAGCRLCASCVQCIRAIASDAGVAIDEGLISGSLRTLNKRQLTRAEKNLDDNLERRAIAAARSLA